MTDLENLYFRIDFQRAPDAESLKAVTFNISVINSVALDIHIKQNIAKKLLTMEGKKKVDPQNTFPFARQ